MTRAALVFLVLWAGLALADGQFAKPWNEICSLGEDPGQGCQDIRAREILDAAAEPWRAIGRVNFASTDLSSHCTGVLISEREVLTAAHCLYNAARKRWIPADSLLFAAGYQRGQAEATSPVRIYEMHPEQGRGGRFDPRPDLDWAVLELSRPLGAEVGYLPLTEIGGNAFVAGYAGVRPHVLSRTDSCAPLVRGGGLLRAICPVMMGDSGAPLLVPSETGPRVAAILSRVAPTASGIDALFLPVTLFPVGGR